MIKFVKSIFKSSTSSNYLINLIMKVVKRRRNNSEKQ